MPNHGPGPGGHPRGTLAVMAIYSALLVLGWFAVYLGVYIARGPLTP